MRFLLSAVLLIVVALRPLPGAATTQSAASKTLVAGTHVEGERSGQDWHSYAIELGAQQFTVVTVAARHAPAVIRVKDPSGRRVVEMTVAAVSILADAAGPYTIEIRAGAGPYEISVDLPRAATPSDRARAAGDRLLSEGRLLASEATAASMRESIAKFELALTSFRESGYRAGEGLALVWLGNSYQRSPNGTQSARDYCNQALALGRELGDRSLQAEALLRLGASYSTPAERPRALDALEHALALFESIDNRHGQAIVLTTIAMAWVDLAEYHKALESGGSALALATAISDSAQASRIYNVLAVASMNLGDLPKALEFYKKALSLGRAGGALRNEFMVINNIGIVYKELGDYRRALEAYTQTLALVRKLELAVREAQVLNNMGNVYRIEGKVETALDHYRQALALFRRLEQPGGQAMTLNNMGSAYALLGDHQKALDYHQQSRTMRQAIGDRRGESSSLHHAGVAWHKLGALEQAAACLREALEVRRQTNDPIGEADTLLALATVQRDRGNPEESRATLESAIGRIESLRARISDAGLRASYIARVQETYASYVDVLMQLHARSPGDGHDRAALRAAERTRARVLLESLAEARGDIREGIDAALLERERSAQRRIDTASERLSQLLAGKSSEADVSAARTDLARVTIEHQEVTAQIRTASPRYAALTQPESLTAEQIQRDVLDENTVLLEFALGPERSWLWAVTPESVASVELPSRREVEAAARSLYEAFTARQPRSDEPPAVYTARIATADRELRHRAAAMSRLLFGGIAGPLHGAWRGKRLAIVAAGALEYLPFAALPLPALDDRSSGGRSAPLPLVARHEIVVAPSASVLATLRQEAAGRRPPHATVAIVADPVFQADDPRVARSARTRQGSVSATRGPLPSPPPEPSYLSSRAVERLEDVRGASGLARLPFSREEADAIADLAGSGATLRATDFEAVRAAVLGTMLEDYRIVHFATHGLVDAERPELSGLILSLVDRRGEPRDGLLRLHDIYNMRLNADLVVLSACQTALGREIRGEGLVGLTRGFMYAGAPRVVASLWQVSDLATADLMKKFYAGMLRRKLRPAAALRAAQLEMSRDRRWSAPYFWAGFVLQGDWR